MQLPKTNLSNGTFATLRRPKMIFLTSPNNPDGSMMPESEIMEILKLPVLVVVDEAYIEFSDRPSMVRRKL